MRLKIVRKIRFIIGESEERIKSILWITQGLRAHGEKSVHMRSARVRFFIIFCAEGMWILFF